MEAIFLQCVETEIGRRGWFGLPWAFARGVGDALAFAVTVRREGHLPSLPEDHALESPFKRKLRSVMRMRDVRETLRFMRKQPVLAGAIVVMLGLGLGASTAIFSVVYGVLLKPLPFPDADRIVQIYGAIPERQIDRMVLSEANFWDLHDQNRTFSEMGAWHSESFSLTGGGEPERVSGARVSVGFFRTLGVQPAAGRLFQPGEDDLGAPAARALLSHGLWTRRFGGNPDVVGSTIMLDGRPTQVLGVLPAGSPWLDSANVFVPFVRRANANRGSWEYVAIGRLKDGISFEAGLDDLKRVSRDLETRYPPNKNLTANLQPASEWIASDDLRRMLWVLLGAVGLLLVIACVNVTNLLLARASGRVRESAVRVALGATRGDLVRERLTESLVLSATGAFAGWWIAHGMLSVLKSLDPGGIPRLVDVGLDGWALEFAIGATLLVGILTGLVPAWHAPVARIVSALRQGQRGAVGDSRQDRLRSVFVAVEVAIALALLVGAGLLVRSLTQVLTVDRGFQTDHRLLVTVSLPSAYGEARLGQLVSDVLARLETTPGVISLATVSGRPLGPGSTGLGIVAADVPPPAVVPWASWRVVTKDYFKTMGVPQLMGRGFTEQDVLGKPWRVIISKRLATLLWGDQNPIGHTALLWKGQGDRPAEIVGVVGDMRERGLESEPTLAVYIPAYGEMATTTLQLVIHTRGNPDDMVPAVRTVVSSLDPTLPVSGARSLEQTVSLSVATRRFTMLLLVTFAGLAVVLALAGVYGVLAYSVARRTSEIGVRLALGAQHGRVLKRVLLQGLRPVVIGAVIGLALALWLSRLMTSLLFGIQPTDVMTYVTVSAALLATAIVACYLPARKVLRVDPVVALRTD